MNHHAEVSPTDASPFAAGDGRMARVSSLSVVDVLDGHEPEFGWDRVSSGNSHADPTAMGAASVVVPSERPVSSLGDQIALMVT
jgi:hypothetical protein